MENYLRSFNLLNENEITSFLKLGQYTKIKKNDYLIKEGKVAKEVAFVLSGIFRSFYYSSSGEEVTYCFTLSNSFITAYSSFITQKKTEENIQALTDVELFIIPKSEITKLENSSLNWLKLMKTVGEQEFIKLEKRVFILQKESAEERYKNLLINNPEYLQLIPLNYLASYLGITQRHLSRVRAKKTI
jgi:CRP-like cAMP-binding protein